MNKKIFQIFFFLIILIAFIVVISKYVNTSVSDIKKFSNIIEKQPRNVISRLSPIIINLSQDINDKEFPLNKPISARIISFYPKIDGYIYFTDKKTIEFQPKEPLPIGTTFRGKLDIHKIYPLIKNAKPFYFKFKVPKLSFNISLNKINYLTPLTGNTPTISGLINFNDYIDFVKIPQLITAHQNNNKLKIDFVPSQDYKSVSFMIKGIQRTKNTDKIVIKWTGKPIKSDITDSTTLTLSPIDSFNFVDYSISYTPKPILKVYFTNAINKAQPISSLVDINIPKKYYDIRIFNNELKFSFNDTVIKSCILKISKKLTTTKGIALKNNIKIPFELKNTEPTICMKDPSIYKTLNNNELSFIGVKVFNLKNITVQITHIADRNMLQFLQINKLNTSRELNRVGEIIFTKTYKLESLLNYKPNQITNYNINLSDIDLSQGGLYNFKFSYNKNDIVFGNRKHTTKTYNQNIIFSNLRAIVKKTPLDSIYIFVYNDIKKELVNNASVEIYDFQQNELANIKTNNEGIAKTKILKNQFFIKIKHKNQITYMSINTNNAILQQNNKELINTNNGVMAYISGLNPKYNSQDSINIAIILKKNGKFKLKKKNIEVKLKTPSNIFINSKNFLDIGTLINIYNVKLPYNSEQGVWYLIIKYENASFKYPFYVTNKYNIFSDNDFIKIDSILKTQKYNISNSTFKPNDTLPILTKNTVLAKNNKDLSITYILNKKTYNIGDTCILKYNLNKNESGLITFENNDGIFYSKWIHSSIKNKEINVKITENMLPGFNIAFISFNNCNTCNNKYIHISHPKDSLWLDLDIDMPYDWTIENNIPIQIINKKQTSLKYYISISPKNKTNKKTVVDYFNQQQNNKIKVWNSNFSIENKHTYKTNFKNTTNENITLIGPFIIKGNTKQTHYLNAKNLNGLINISIIGAENNTGYLFEKRKYAKIYNPISIKIKHPTYVNCGDIVILELQIKNNKQQDDTLLIKINDLKNFDIASDIEKQIILKKDSLVKTKIVIKAKKTIANGSLSIICKSNKIFTKNNVIIPIQSNPIYSQNNISIKVLPSQTWQHTLIPIGIRGTNTAKLEISESETPNFLKILNTINENKSSELQYIIDKSFPLIYYNNLLSNKKNIYIYSETIKNALITLKKYQAPNGGFFNNLNSKQTSQDITNYAGDFMLEAKRNGYDVNENIFNNWIRYQKREILKIQFIQTKAKHEWSYTLYTLTKSNFLEIDNLIKYKNYLSSTLIEKLYLALSFIELKQIKQAEVILNKINIKKNINHFNIKEVSLMLDIYNKLDNNLSILLSTHLNKLIKNKKNTSTEIILSLNSILKNIKNKKYNNSININYQINHGEDKKFISKNRLSYLNIPLEFTLPKHIDIVNTSKDTIYINLLNSGSSNKIKNTYLKQNKIKIKNTYLNIDNSPINMNDIKEGTFYKQIISYNNTDKNKKQRVSVFIPVSAGVKLIYSNKLMMFDLKANGIENLLKTEMEIEPLKTNKIILIFKTIFTGKYNSFPIKTYTKNYFYYNKYTPQFNIQIK